MPISYAATLPDYTVGQLIDMREWNGTSRILATGANLPFGVPVVTTTAADLECAPLTAAAQNVIGISRMNHVLYHEGDYYSPGDTVSVIDEGPIAVLLGANVTKGAQARFDVTAQRWTGATASATVLTIPGAQFEFAGVSGAVGVVRYKRPIPSLSAST